MNNFDNFDRKSFRKEKFDSKKKTKKFESESYDEQRFAKLNKKQIKRKIQDLQEEERWEDWENEIS